MSDTEIEAEDVEHDPDSCKFFVPFSDKQAVLRYTRQGEDEEDEEIVIDFQAIFIPPSLQSSELKERILQRAYEYIEDEGLEAEPPTIEKYLDEFDDPYLSEW